MRLSQQSLATANAVRPAYARSALRPGIVHLGIGNFHRAHQAAYIDACLADDPNWGIIGVSLRRSNMRDALTPQDNFYTLATRSDTGTECRIIGSVVKVLHAGSDVDAVNLALEDPAIRIVSLTVTEKGYCHDPASGNLDFNNPAIAADLAAVSRARTVPGLLYQALAARRAAGTAPFTVLSCDNLPSNGRTLRRIVLQYAQQLDQQVADWIEEKVAFPSTMIDRIVPATTDSDRAEIRNLIGLEDAWPVMAEPFSQWVIEDDFPAGRPEFSSHGVELVDDVEPYELMKLRMLNGSHSTLAYLSQLLALDTVSDAIGHEGLARHIDQMMALEIAPTLSMTLAQTDQYRLALLSRFRNPALRHQTRQIAMDGSQKIPQRLLGTIRDRIAKNLSFERLACGVAAWIVYVFQADIDTIDDPMRAQFEELKTNSGADISIFAKSMLGLDAVFGDLGSSNRFATTVLAMCQTLVGEGAESLLEQLAEDASL